MARIVSTPASSPIVRRRCEPDEQLDPTPLPRRRGRPDRPPPSGSGQTAADQRRRARRADPRSLREFGFVQPVLARRDDGIVVGAALFWEMRAISAEAQLETAGPARGTSGRRTARWAAWRAAVASLIGSLYIAEEARAYLERRYLDGYAALFPEAVDDWQATCASSAERLAGVGRCRSDSPRSTDAGHSRTHASHRSTINLRQLRAAARDRAPEPAASMVDVARAAALDALGDTDGAATIADRRVRVDHGT